MCVGKVTMRAPTQVAGHGRVAGVAMEDGFGIGSDGLAEEEPGGLDRFMHRRNLEGLADLPVMSVGIDDAAYAPTILLVVHWGHLGRAGGESGGEHGVRIVDREDETGGGAA